MKNSLQRQIEILKIITPLEISAYLELYSAAANYYRALAPLETGEWNANRAEKAEEMMVKAEATSVFIQVDAHKVFWRDIWQDARIIVEKAKLYSNAEGWNQVWREEVYTFGQDLRRFEEAAKSASDRLIAPS